MNKSILWAMVILTIFAVAFQGCSKKVVKQEAPVEVKEPEPSPTPAPEPAPAPAPVPEPVKKELSFSNVYFDFDKYDIRPDAREILVQHAQSLLNNPSVKILVEGHCDERGTIEYNLALGEKRANAVKNFLVNYGVAADRISTISYGKERPLDPRSNEEAWAKNRRAQFVIVAQ